MKFFKKEKNQTNHTTKTKRSPRNIGNGIPAQAKQNRPDELALPENMVITELLQKGGRKGKYDAKHLVVPEFPPICESYFGL